MDIHSHLIRDMHEDTGKTMRELEWEWKKAERQVELDRMNDPDKYSHLRKTDGTLAQEVARKFKDNVLGSADKVEEEADQLTNDMEQGIEEDIDLGLELEPEVDKTEPETEGFDDADASLDAFMEENPELAPNETQTTEPDVQEELPE